MGPLRDIPVLPAPMAAFILAFSLRYGRSRLAPFGNDSTAKILCNDGCQTIFHKHGCQHVGNIGFHPARPKKNSRKDDAKNRDVNLQLAPLGRANRQMVSAGGRR
jgi:hypothetical protein